MEQEKGVSNVSREVQYDQSAQSITSVWRGSSAVHNALINC